MILSYKNEGYTIPHTSKCIIHTTGTINDGDNISVTSPVFASINFTSKAINTSESFDVVIRILNTTKSIIISEDTIATLVCDDNDPFNMYVRIQ